MAFTNQYLIDFFKQRMLELFDENTLDSYSVRTCNTMSMFCEMKEMLEGWVAGNVKHGNTVARCVEECISMIDIDEWMDFSFFDKKKTIAALEDFTRKVSKIKDSRDKNETDTCEARYIHHLVNTCISANDTSYLSTLISSIKVDLFSEKTYQNEDFSEVIHNLDIRLSFLATELLRRGYSKPYLYFFFKSIKENKKGLLFPDAFEQLQDKFGAVQQYEDIVIIKMSFQSKNVPEMENMVDEVPADYLDLMLDSTKGLFKKAPNRRFYIVKEIAADTNSALQKARLRLSRALDINDIGLVNISNNAAILYTKDGRPAIRLERNFEKNRVSSEAKPLPSIIQSIVNSEIISKDIKDRLDTALRHLRVGDEQTEIEQRFLNYWIGLEFIFSTPKSGDSTFIRIIEKFPTIKTLYYLKRNVLNLDSRLKEKGLLGDEDSFGKWSEKQMDLAYDATEDVLLKYRIKCMKSHLHHTDKVKDYLGRHIKTLGWHISRIYHLRNELVHEAAINHNIEGVATNLRSYLVFMLNLMLDYCNVHLKRSFKDPLTMENFFWYYELLWEKCTPEYDKNSFLDFDIPKSIVS